MPYGTITAPNGLWLRSGPKTDSPKLLYMPFACRVEIAGQRRDGWLLLRCAHQEGFAPAEWVGREPEPAPVKDGPSAGRLEGLITLAVAAILIGIVILAFIYT